MPQFRPTCPRCGYDLSGLADSWKDACPLTGTCSECGHTLDWPTVMHPELVRLPGLYEHARAWWSLGPAWRTWAWTLRPWFFSRKVTLDHQPIVRRLLLWLFVLILPLHILVALSRSTGWILWAPTLARGASRGTLALGAWDWQRHLVFWATPVGHLQSSPFGTRTLEYAWYTTFKSAPAFPFIGIAVMLAVPATLLLLTSTRARSKVRAGHLLRCTIYGLAWLPLIFIITTANALHTLYLSWGVATAGSAGWRPSPISSLIFNSYPTLWLVFIVAWSMLWWWYAVKHFLKLHQPGFVWTMMMTIALLVGLLVGLFVGPNWLISRFL